MGTDEVITTLVSVFLFGFSECALHILDTRSIGYFSHNVRRLPNRSKMPVRVPTP